jgi:DNA-directed RNA polymerase subunit H (RpoH/RPB5)
MDHLFQIKKTQIEMIYDRGYDVSKEELDLLDNDLNYFTDYLRLKTGDKITRASLSQVYSMKGKKQLLVAYLEKSPDSKQISIEVIRSVIEQAKSLGVKELIIVIEIVLSSPAKKDLIPSGLSYQVFFDDDLCYNATRHIDTPRHELLTPTEAEEKLKELKADIGKLLIIKSTDPIVKYYNWPVEGIVRIFREDYTVSILSPKSVNYRVISI